jgi:RHS repeat-associated protein
VLYDSNASSTYTPGFAQNQGGTDRYLHSDWLGSTRYLSDSTGNSFPGMLRYDAFGGRSATSGADGYYPTTSQFAGDFGYQTEYASTTEPGVGLQYLDQRYYDPSLGRFIGQDPIGFGGGLNLYPGSYDPGGSFYANHG